MTTNPLYEINMQLPISSFKPEGCEIIVADALTVLKSIPSKTFRCCVTSPPYWGLRDYGIPGQIGAETELEDYIKNLVAVFSEIRRVLKDDGTLWLNIGDSYTSGNRTWRDEDKKILPVPWNTVLQPQKD